VQGPRLLHVLAIYTELVLHGATSGPRYYRSCSVASVRRVCVCTLARMSCALTTVHIRVLYLLQLCRRLWWSGMDDICIVHTSDITGNAARPSNCIFAV
jgi:hypothetical protein